MLLSGGSDKSCDQSTLLTDTVDTIAAAGEAEITIYMDGSAESVYKNGGSAALVTSGPATDSVKNHLHYMQGKTSHVVL